jgi:predicted SnoaL-like aldol condensation-catalyzing enzyme
MIFNQHNLAQAVAKYIGANFREHNPYVADGRQGVMAYTSRYIKANPKMRMEFKRIIAESDIMAVYRFLKPNSSDLGRAVVDIFRVEDGKLVEHWDVMQPVPLQVANRNGVF